MHGALPRESNPAPKFPPGEDAKGSKRPLLRRDRSSTRRGQAREHPGQPALVPRHRDTAQAHCPGTAGLKATAGLCQPGTPGAHRARIPALPAPGSEPRSQSSGLSPGTWAASRCPHGHSDAWCPARGCAGAECRCRAQPIPSLCVTRCPCSVKGTFLCLPSPWGCSLSDASHPCTVPGGSPRPCPKLQRCKCEMLQLPDTPQPHPHQIKKK